MKTQIKTFFYAMKNKEMVEKEVNDFLAEKGSAVKKILQSGGSISLDQRDPLFIDIAVAITVIYSE